MNGITSSSRMRKKRDVHPLTGHQQSSTLWAETGILRVQDCWQQKWRHCLEKNPAAKEIRDFLAAGLAAFSQLSAAFFAPRGLSRALQKSAASRCRKVVAASCCKRGKHTRRRPLDGTEPSGPGTTKLRRFAHEAVQNQGRDFL